ncbi:MAG TPA: SEC-C domain-containing protein [Candidatus Faecimonas gallistercoris]|nr:SEC-C domain-containing protein [Candidatus Faecimonas gallistercoris]
MICGSDKKYKQCCEK